MYVPTPTVRIVGGESFLRIQETLNKEKRWRVTRGDDFFNSETLGDFVSYVQGLSVSNLENFEAISAHIEQNAILPCNKRSVLYRYIFSKAHIFVKPSIKRLISRGRYKRHRNEKKTGRIKVRFFFVCLVLHNKSSGSCSLKYYPAGRWKRGEPDKGVTGAKESCCFY